MRQPIILLVTGLLLLASCRSKSTTESTPDIHPITSTCFGLFIHWGANPSLSGTPEGAIVPLKFDAEEWVMLAKEAGIDHIIFTDQGHNNNSLVRNPKKEMEEACRKAGMPFIVCSTRKRETETNACDPSCPTAAHFIRHLAIATASNGSVLMNIIPKSDGSIHPRDVKTLKDIAKWWKVNGDISIRGASPSQLAEQTWGETTCKGDTLYLHVFQPPKDGRLRVGGLHAEVDKAYLLYNKLNLLKTTRMESDLLVEMPRGIEELSNIVIALECEPGKNISK